MTKTLPDSSSENILEFCKNQPIKGFASQRLEGFII